MTPAEKCEMKRLFAHGNFAVFLPNAGLVIFQLQDQAWEGSEQQDSEFATLHVLCCYLPQSPSGFCEHAGVFIHFAPLLEDPFGILAVAALVCSKRQLTISFVMPSLHKWNSSVGMLQMMENGGGTW